MKTRLSLLLSFLCFQICFSQTGKSSDTNKISIKDFTGHYEGTEPYCRMSIRIKRDHKVKINRKCEGNRGYMDNAKWKIENDTFVVYGSFDDERIEWILIKDSLYEVTADKKRLVAIKQN